MQKEKENEDSTPVDYSDIKLENVEIPENQTQNKYEHDDKKNDSDTAEKSGSDYKKAVEEATKNRLEVDKKLVKKPVEKAENDAEIFDFDEHLQLGSISINGADPNHHLVSRALRVMLQNYLAPDQRGGDILTQLAPLSQLLKRYRSSELRQLLLDANSAHQHDHPELSRWVTDLLYKFRRQDMNAVYQEVHHIHLAVHTYANVLDSDGKVPVPNALLSKLDEALKFLEKFCHPEAQDMGIVRELFDGLPPLARRILKTEYNLDTIGLNSPTANVAKKLRQNKLVDLRLLAKVSPLTDFILNPEYRPENSEVKSWDRDYSKPFGRDILPFQRFGDWPRALLGQPGKSLEENMLAGTAFVQTHRKRIFIPAGHSKEEAERMTVVLFDISGSMFGDPAQFQAAIIGAFAAAALSDVSPSGKYRHKMLLVPFDTSPGEPIIVSNAAEALEVIKNYQKKLTKAGGGTDIQVAYLAGLGLIADAGRRNGEPLAAGNIILMTDGQAGINAQELAKARNAIDRRTPLQTMFIAINNTNEDLRAFAMDSQSIGSDRGFYREFSPELIGEVIKDAKNFQSATKRIFYATEHGSKLPQEFDRILNQTVILGMGPMAGHKIIFDKTSKFFRIPSAPNVR